MEALAAGDPARIGPFRLVAKLGRGGMGAVYLGRSDATGRSVAVKTIHGELAADREFRTRFAREVAAARRVRDAYIAEVVDADPDAQVPWLATAYVPGIAVDDAVRRYGPLPEDTVRVLGVCIARAVAAIHAVQLVHRDLKPGNVLLTAAGPKVIDFGIARGQAEAGLTRTGMVSGSPPYMAPEQLLTGSFGPGSDVFALGAILHFAATAAGPYGRGGAQEQYARALAVGATIDEALPGLLREPISRCFVADPAARPAAAELSAWLENEPGERPAAGWLPSAIAQEILLQATDALNTESAGGIPMAQPIYQPPQAQPSPPMQAPRQQPSPWPQFPGQMSGTPGRPGAQPGPYPPRQAGPASMPGPTMSPPRIGGPGASIPSVPGGAPMQQPHPSFPPHPVAQPRWAPPRPDTYGPYYSQQARGGMPPTNSAATAGMVFALLGIIMPCSLPVGLLLGLIGLGKTGQSGTGRGKAVTAVVVSAVMIVFWVAIVVAVNSNTKS